MLRFLRSLMPVVIDAFGFIPQMLSGDWPKQSIRTAVPMQSVVLKALSDGPLQKSPARR